MKRILVGKRIERARLARGLSTQKLAALINKSQATVSRIENGKQGVTLELLAEIAGILQVHPFTFLAEQPQQHQVCWGTGTIRSNGPLRLLAHTLLESRLRAHLERSQVATRLGINENELEAIESGYSLPSEDTLQRMGDLYPVDAGLLDQLLKQEKECPQLSERMCVLESILGECLEMVRQQKKTPELASLCERLETVVREPAEELSAERQARYFSIGHLSDRLLAALQNPEFHQKVEELAREYDESQPENPGGQPPPRQQASRRQA